MSFFNYSFVILLRMFMLFCYFRSSINDIKSSFVIFTRTLLKLNVISGHNLTFCYNEYSFDILGRTLAYLECELRNKTTNELLVKGSHTKFVG
jgi:hypothetical protein